MQTDWQEKNDTVETSETQFTADVNTSLSDAGIQAMQGSNDVVDTPSEQLEAETPGSLEPPPEHIPKPALGEAGMAERIEEGAEKGEKEIFYGRGPERLG